jgi:hypothetical protein
MAYIISRFQEGISLNPREFILDKKNKLMKFSTPQKAEEFLLNAGVSKEAINESIFIDDEDEI